MKRMSVSRHQLTYVWHADIPGFNEDVHALVKLNVGDGLTFFTAADILNAEHYTVNDEYTKWLQAHRDTFIAWG